MTSEELTEDDLLMVNDETDMSGDVEDGEVTTQPDEGYNSGEGFRFVV